MDRSRAAWIISAALLTMPIEASAETIWPVVLRTCPPGTVVAVDRAAGISFVDLDSGACIQPWSALHVPFAISQASSTGGGASLVGPGIVAIAAVALLALAIVAGVVVCYVRGKALDTEFKKVALRDRRCSPAKEVASQCATVIALLGAEETGGGDLETLRKNLVKACTEYRAKALAI